ncbi:MAG: glycosyltransferase family 4 protein [Methanobacteriaceae archaeon]|nr:glycosyltransferase family 4 protein [Methanobacteriaceae archaeon]
MKIINILHHSLSPYNKEADPLFYEDAWHIGVAKGVKKYTNQYDLECWRPERNLKKEQTRTEDGITHRIFPSNYFLKFENSPLLLNRLKASYDEEIIVHLHGIVYPFSYMILSALNKEIPIIGQSHEASSTLSNAIFKKKVPNRLKTLGKPIISLERLFQKKMLSKIDYFFCLNEEEKTAFSKFGKSIIQPMGVDFERFKPIKKEEALKITGLDNLRYIIYVGRLDKRKGLEYLLKSFKKILEKYDRKLILAGEGPFKKKLISLSKNLEIYDKLIFLGHTKNSKLPYYYNISDVTIFPSTIEAYSIVPIESLACKTPIITTNVGAIPEITKKFKTGSIIIPHNNIDATFKAFDTINSNINNIKIDRKNGEKFYDWKSIIKNTVNIYEELYKKYYE